MTRSQFARAWMRGWRAFTEPCTHNPAREYPGMPKGGIPVTYVSCAKCPACQERAESAWLALQTLSAYGEKRAWSWRMWRGRVLVTNHAPAFPGIIRAWTWGAHRRRSMLPIVWRRATADEPAVIEHCEFGIRMD